MEESGRNEPHLGANPYAPPEGTPESTATPPPATAAPGRYPVVFSATAGEYFRIWIVNLALTVLTLGIYSAWAKVRKKRYFYGHTTIDGDSFEYSGQPLAILKGRLIAMAAFGIFFAISRFAPEFQWILFIAGIFVLPWLLVRSLAFNAYNTTFRNVRLNFRGTYSECLKIIVGYGLLMLVTFGIGYIYLKIRMVRFAADNHYFGITPFKADDLKKPLTSVYSNAIGLGLLIVVVTVVFGFLIGASSAGRPSAQGPLGMLLPLVGYIGYLYVFAYVRAGVANGTFNNLSVGSVRFEFTLRAGELFRIYLVNILAIIASLGLATPWAVVRTLRDRASKAELMAAEGLDRFVATEAAQVSAAGEEVGEMFDIDIGL